MLVKDDTRVELARTGDLSAFNDLVVEYQSLVFNVCLRMLGQQQAAEDAAQEAFINAWRSIGSFRGDSFRAWLLRIAGNLCRDELRRRGRRPATSLDTALEAGMPDPLDDDPLPEESVLNAELRVSLEAALAGLPDEQRMALVLSDVEGLDYSEISVAMNTSLGTVKSRIARARMRMREVMLRQPELLPGRFRQGDREARA